MSTDSHFDALFDLSYPDAKYELCWPDSTHAECLMRAKSEGSLKNVWSDRNVGLTRCQSSHNSKKNLFQEGDIQVQEAPLKPRIEHSHFKCSPDFILGPYQSIEHSKRREIHNTFVGYLLQIEIATHKPKQSEEDAIWDQLLQ